MNPLTSLMRKRRRRPRDVQHWLMHSSSNKSDVRTTVIVDLTDGLLIEIFVRLLHVKSVNQCKSVCKRWLTLISTPWLVRSFVRHQITVSSNGRQSPPSSTPLRFPFTFITEHPELHHEEYFRLISSPDMFGLGGLSLTYLPCYERDESRFFVISVLASSNDLILCESRLSPGFYYVSNPFTKHWAKIPSGGYKGSCYRIIGFVCDPFYKVVDNENGYHTIDTMYRYKIVRVSYLTPCASWMPHNLEIFSSETGEWSELDLNIACPQLLQVIDTHLCSGSGGFLSNGKLHWMCEQNYIFAYDPFNSNNNNNNVQVIDRPVELRGAKDVHLGGSGERLRLLGFRENIRLVVWELEDYSTGQWCKVKEVAMDMVARAIHETIRFMVITMSIAFHPYDENIVYMWCPYSASYVISFNMQHGSFETVIAGSNDNKLHYVADKVFLLLQPWFPTPVSSPLLSY